MRRTAALIAVTLLLSATLGAASRDDAVPAPPPPTDQREGPREGMSPAVPGAPLTVPPSSDLGAATLAQGPGPGEGQGAGQAEGQILDQGGPSSGLPRPAPDSGATASQRPALTAVLDPAAGATLVAGGSALAGSGPTHRYSVEVEPLLGLDVELVRAVIEEALHDEVRSWARTRTLQRVDDPRMARIRVVLASPETVDAICATVGLNTAGIFSCWTGRIAALNAWRWEVGAAGFPDVASYRTYLINHEFGHALGYGHVSCPRSGAIAPVMMQQSKGLGGCTANGWPYP